MNFSQLYFSKVLLDEQSNWPETAIWND